MIKAAGRLLILICIFCYSSASAQDKRDSLHVRSTSQYLQQVKNNPDKALVEIVKYDRRIQLDIRYATLNNFMHQRMYTQACAFARAPVVKALKQVEDDLAAQGLGLKIFDAYRPYTVTVKFYEKASDKHFVADPKKGSKHNRGCAVDLTLIDLKTGKPLAMPTDFDSFSRTAAADYPDLPPLILHNRQILKTAMENHGFRVLSNEWWHFDFIGWQNYELLDVPFNEL